MQVVLGLLARFWWVVLIAAIGVGGLIFREHLTGAADDLRVGDCIDVPAAVTEIEELQHRPCGDPHDAEVFLVVDHPADRSAAFPTERARFDFVSAQCTPAFNTYTGRDYQSDTELDFGWFYPTNGGWSDGDREFTCYIARVDGAKLTRSMRSTAPAASP